MKVSIIGAGNVGATAAMKIAAEGFVNEVVLLDVKEGVAEGKAMDIMQSLMMTDSNTIVIGTTGDYSKTANSELSESKNEIRALIVELLFSKLEP